MKSKNFLQERWALTAKKANNPQKLNYLVYLLIFPLLFFTNCSTEKVDDSSANETNLRTNLEANENRAQVAIGVETLFITSSINIDLETANVTLPIFKGQHDGETVWYIITESSNEKNAKKLGINFAPKLSNALGTAAVQNARFINAQTGRPVPASPSFNSQGVVLDFDGSVDFSPERIVVPGPEGFPPSQFQAGAVGDLEYSPLVTTGDGIVLNASQIANDSGLHDAVVDIDFKKREATLDQFRGFYEFEEVLYLHQEASLELVAAVEGSTFAPNLNAAPGLGSNNPETSARSAIIPVVNGERGVDNPDRQGLQSALLGQGDPLNITQEEPGFEDGEVLYSPVWDIHLIVWTQEAIDVGERRLLTDADEIAQAFVDGLLVSGTPNSGIENSSLLGLEALGGISNCPITANLGPVVEQ